MVAWVSTTRGRREIAAIGAGIAVLGALATLGGMFFSRPLMWFGIALLLLAMVIAVWAFAHKTISGLQPLPRKVDARWRRVADHAEGALIDVRFGGTYTSDGFASREMAEVLGSAITHENAAAVIIDLTELEFHSGDDLGGLGALAMPLARAGGDLRLAAVVASERGADQLKWLFEPNMILGVAGMKLFRRRDEALAHLRTALFA
jgi:hypothetical protein